MGEQPLVWLTPVEYGRLFGLAYATVVEMCRLGKIHARKDPANGYFWQIPIDKDAYDALTKEA